MFKDGLFDGLGVFRWEGGRRYEGEFAAGKRIGLGVLWSETGMLHECGRWDGDKLVGRCEVPLRLIPEGKFLSAAALKAKRDHPNGSLAQLGDGRYFIGSINERGQPHDQGASFHPDGSPYVTLLIDAADLSKSGRWINGKLNGRAVVISANSHRYEGLFKNGRFNGLGLYSWKDGERFEGEWAAGSFHGFGALWDKDGKLVQCGRWFGGKFVLSCSVPLSCIPDGMYLSAAAQSARQSHPDTTLLLPGGGHYTGDFNADTLRLHGVGAEFDAAGADSSRRVARGIVPPRLGSASLLRRPIACATGASMVEASSQTCAMALWSRRIGSMAWLPPAHVWQRTGRCSRAS